MPRQPEISLGDYPSSIMAYLKERGLKPEVMHRLGVGWAELPADTPDGKKTFLAFRFLERPRPRTAAARLRGTRS
jgi:twinkle protein